MTSAPAATPVPIEAEPFAALPPGLRRGDRSSRWAEAVLGIEHVDSFLEGPCFGRDGTLYVSDLAHGRILTISQEGAVSVLVETDGAPNGLAVHRDGNLWVADYRRGIVALDPKTGRYRVVVDRYRFEALRGVSDLVFGADGTLYFAC